MPERDFKGIWIPASVWLDDRLSALDKVILAEIDSLDGEKGCWASNDYISEFCQCSSSKVSRAISKLTELGYVRVESFNGRFRVLRSSLLKNARQSRQFCKADEAILQDSNINNKIENNKESRKRFSPPTVEDVKVYCTERGNNIDPETFVDYYSARGWKYGQGKPVVDWKAAVRNWEKRDSKYNGDDAKKKKQRKFETVLIDGQYVDVEIEA